MHLGEDFEANDKHRAEFVSHVSRLAFLFHLEKKVCLP